MEAARNEARFNNAKYDAAWAIRFRPEPEAARTRPGAHHVRYAARHLVIDEGDAARAVYEVLDGGVILFKLLPDGRRQIIELLGVGDVFGLAVGPVADVAAEALTPVRLAVFEPAAVDADPALRDRLFARLRAQMCALHDHALLLGRKSAQERVATYLMRLVPGRGGLACIGAAPGNAEVRIELRMSRQEIADYLGLTIETVSRTFSALRRANLISYRKQDEVVVPNLCRLCRLTGAH
ncbi:MAG: helix-turn-helix protein [Microvirga sp.]|jgi:CRP-like cAMP-binding protein|nr:helix-turn-helix protein [Microvirga sp.]